MSTKHTLGVGGQGSGICQCPAHHSRHRLFRVIAACGLAILLAPNARADGPLSADALRVKQETQQRAREMAHELVSGILEVQLKQLEQNGLQKLDLYRDIQLMRKHIDVLVESEMREVVDLLVEAQKAEPADRQQDFLKARGKIREIVTRLAVERQNLARRLRIAELTAQVRILITKESAVMRVTESLSDLPKQKQGETTLDTIQNQHDVRVLFIQLVNALADVSTWGGQVGAGAADGLRILKAGQTGARSRQRRARARIVKIRRRREEPTFHRQHPQGVARKARGRAGLAQFVERGSPRDGSRADEATRANPSGNQAGRSEGSRSRAARRSREPIAQGHGEAHRMLERVPGATPALEQAKAAAFAATSDLFEAKKSEALDQETKTLGDLAEIERKLEQASEAEGHEKSAAELAQQVKNLEAAQKQVAEVQRDEKKAADAAKSDAPAAKQADQQAAEALAKAAEPTPLPAAVKSRLQEAAEAAKDAAQAETAAATPEAKQAAQQAAQEATDRAAAEIAAALNDTKLNEKAVSAGELARAAEAAPVRRRRGT